MRGKAEEEAEVLDDLAPLLENFNPAQVQRQTPVFSLRFN